MKGYYSNKEFKAIRHTVTGIGWATPQQAAVYVGLTHREICDRLSSDEIPYSRVSSQRRRIRYSDLDEYMLSLREQNIDLDALRKRIRKEIHQPV